MNNIIPPDSRAQEALENEGRGFSPIVSGRQSAADPTIPDGWQTFHNRIGEGLPVMRKPFGSEQKTVWEEHDLPLVPFDRAGNRRMTQMGALFALTN